MEFLNLLLSNFWNFVGLMIFSYIITFSIIKIIRFLIALFIIIFRGYPPEHCDAFGDINSRINKKHIDNEINPSDNQ